MRIRHLILLISLLAPQGCNKLSRPEVRFPIGMFGVTNVGELSRLKELGFDSFQTNEKDPSLLSQLAREAQRQGMDMVLYPDQVITSTFSQQAMSWPVGAWLLAGAPETHKLPTDPSSKLNDALKAWSPQTRTASFSDQGPRNEQFSGTVDALMLGWYPVPYKPMETVADELDKTRMHLPEDKPLWAVLQAHNRADNANYTPQIKTDRFPNFNEIRFMSYLSIVHGAKGIYYFTLQKPGGRSLLDFPEEFQSAYRVAWELKGLQPILEHGKRISLPFDVTSKDLEAMALRYRMRDYVIVLNRRKDAMLKMPDELLHRRWRPLFETRRHAKELLTETKGAWYLGPYRALVFESSWKLETKRTR